MPEYRALFVQAYSQPAGSADPCKATPGTFDIGGRYAVTAMRLAARMMRTMIGAYLMMGSYVTALPPSSAPANPRK
jgi:hypothetical protein